MTAAKRRYTRECDRILGGLDSCIEAPSKRPSFSNETEWTSESLAVELRWSLYLSMVGVDAVGKGCSHLTAHEAAVM